MDDKLAKLRDLFNTNKSGDTHCFSLVCWTDGFWSVEVTDDWDTMGFWAVSPSHFTKGDIKK